MRGLLLCGKTAKNPLYISDVDLNIYSMEELNYYMYNNVYMISPDFFNDKLMDFIVNEMGLEKVGKKLKDQMYREESYIEMIKTILDGSYYYSDREKAEVVKVLAELEHKTPVQRIKLRADVMAERGRYRSALAMYRECVGRKDSGKADSEMVAMAWNNMGVIYSKLFMSDEAINCFKMACDIHTVNEYMDNLICSALLTENSQIIEKIGNKYHISAETFERYGQAIKLNKKDILDNIEVQKLMDSVSYNDEQELADYYKRIDNVLEMWKRTYREQIL